MVAMQCLEYVEYLAPQFVGFGCFFDDVETES